MSDCKCSHCEGTGRIFDGKYSASCPSCDGSGKVTKRDRVIAAVSNWIADSVPEDAEVDITVAFNPARITLSFRPAEEVSDE